MERSTFVVRKGKGKQDNTETASMVQKGGLTGRRGETGEKAESLFARRTHT